MMKCAFYFYYSDLFAFLCFRKATLCTCFTHVQSVAFQKRAAVDRKFRTINTLGKRAKKMSENNTTDQPVTGSYHASLRFTLDHMAEQNYIEWDEDYDSRRDRFFAALASEDDTTSTIDGALGATFGDLNEAHQLTARLMFEQTYNNGTAAPKPRKRRRVGLKPDGVVHKTFAALTN